MSDLLFVPENRKAELDALNEREANRGICTMPIELKDGGYVLPANLLTECGEGQTWEIYTEFLKSLSTFEGEPIFKVDDE